jgi:hypothetical protein
MSGRIRVLDSANRAMQRLGYLKILCAIVNETETSNLTSLGKRLIERITQSFKISPPFSEEIRDYARVRLYDGKYKNLRKSILENSGDTYIQSQDYYLADSNIPSNTGKLVEADWRMYPYLGTSLEFIKKGTYSPLTRSLLLLNLTPKEELNAFSSLNLRNNPFIISDAQAMVFLFCLIDNDGEILFPLYEKLLNFNFNSFNEREAGDYLPEIFRNVTSIHEKRALTVEEKDRIAIIKKMASTIEQWKGKPYTGSGAREIAIRVRLEPFCDIKLLDKIDHHKFEYLIGESMQVFINKWSNLRNIDKFLLDDFFSTFAKCRKWEAYNYNVENAIEYLYSAGESLKSSLGYSPIKDVGLLAGIKLLIEKKQVLEISDTIELLKMMQKRRPNQIRFTVDRMGTLSYVKFLK